MLTVGFSRGPGSGIFVTLVSHTGISIRVLCCSGGRVGERRRGGGIGPRPLFFPRRCHAFERVSSLKQGQRISAGTEVLLHEALTESVQVRIVIVARSYFIPIPASSPAPAEGYIDEKGDTITTSDNALRPFKSRRDSLVALIGAPSAGATASTGGQSVEEAMRAR